MVDVTVSVPEARLGEFYALVSQFFGGEEDNHATKVEVAVPLMRERRDGTHDGARITGRYAPLYKYFLEVPGDTLDVTFLQIEDALGSQLPRSAREHRSVWSNSEGSFLGRVWLLAGWHLTDIEMHAERARFVRN